MEYRQLGRTGLEVSPVTFGGNVFGWTIDEQQSVKILDAWVDAGFNFIDTADVYSAWVPGNKGGESETIIGNWIKARGNRDKVIISTKVGSEMGAGKKGLSKDYILKAANASLQRLQTDYIDLYQAHWPDNDTPHQESLEAFNILLGEGKVKAIGASNFSASQLVSALEAAKNYGMIGYQTLQPLYNLYERSIFEDELKQVVLERHLGVLNYYSLASGFLTGKYRSEADLKKSARGGGVKKYLNERGYNILKALDTVSEKHSATPASVSIAWLLHRPAVTAPIASATTTNQLDEFRKAVELKLDTEDMELLGKASSE